VVQYFFVFFGGGGWHPVDTNIEIKSPKVLNFKHYVNNTIKNETFKVDFKKTFDENEGF